MSFPSDYFDPEELANLQRVYAEACCEVGVDEKPSEPSWNSERRAQIAAAILELARFGETDPRALKAFALRPSILPRDGEYGRAREASR